ncbi:MAG: non-canonical purine NTP pyrophosphatase, partial [Nanoarchaeota archaeon]|nr:non-canonical purine NTP pyrophosphatase [Nanoarchaeota archaeon]
ESRKAYFNSVIAFCDGKTVLFEGRLDCEVSAEVHDPDKDVMPYMRIMLFGGRPLSDFSKLEKDRISHRAKAFRQLGEFLDKRRNNAI